MGSRWCTLLVFVFCHFRCSASSSLTVVLFPFHRGHRCYFLGKVLRELKWRSWPPPFLPPSFMLRDDFSPIFPPFLHGTSGEIKKIGVGDVECVFQFSSSFFFPFLCVRSTSPDMRCDPVFFLFLFLAGRRVYMERRRNATSTYPPPPPLMLVPRKAAVFPFSCLHTFNIKNRYILIILSCCFEEYFFPSSSPSVFALRLLGKCLPLVDCGSKEGPVPPPFPPPPPFLLSLSGGLLNGPPLLFPFFLLVRLAERRKESQAKLYLFPLVFPPPLRWISPISLLSSNPCRGPQRVRREMICRRALPSLSSTAPRNRGPSSTFRL